jgi:uncharacterized membrane protein
VVESEGPARPRGLGISLIAGGALGLLAAAALIVEKIQKLEHPAAQLGCDISVLVGCSTSLDSRQGALLGIPNPVLGIVFWTAVTTVGVVILAVTLPRWIWWALAAGMTGAFALVVWFIAQSIYVLGVLCPWCMLTWAVTIPLFLLVAGHVARSGVLPVGPVVRRGADVLYRWVFIITLVAAFVIALLAQVRLGVLTHLG